MDTEYDDLRPPISLTAVERQSFILLHKVLQHLDADETEHHARMVEVLTEGFTMEYEDLFTPYSELSKSDCKLVFDILDMFRIIKGSLRSLDSSERDALLAEHKYQLRYQGLDGNDSREGKLASYVKFVQATGRWTELREDVEAADGGNSHSLMLGRYLAMLNVYRPIWQEVVGNPGGSGYHLSAEQLRQVAASSG